MTAKKPEPRTSKDETLGLALQQVYYRGVNWLEKERCSNTDCPYLDAVRHFVDLAHEALEAAGLKGTLLGRVGLIPLPRRG
ncbi:MAG: hypothetical protein HYU25_17950 [Candidatus Rokubacteria bacterium]|nr:hypothetical protein [Candidatus Rokubacteria bacterium]